MVGFDVGQLPAPSVSVRSNSPSTRDVGTQYDEETREWEPRPDGGRYQIHPAFESWLDDAGWMETERPGLDAAFEFMRENESILREKGTAFWSTEDKEGAEGEPLVMSVNNLPDFVRWLVAERDVAQKRSAMFLKHMLDMTSAK